MHPIESNERDHDKAGGSSIDKSGTVVVAVPGHGGITLDTEHVIDVKDGRKQLIYLSEKSYGIDFIVTRRTVTARSQEAQELLDAHTGGDTDDDEEPRTNDVNAFREFRDVDYVKYDGDGYRIFDIVGPNTLAIDQPMKRVIEVPADECTPTDVWGTPLADKSDDDDEKRLMTDGGRDVVEPELTEDRVNAGDTVKIIDRSSVDLYWVVSVRGDRVTVEHADTGDREALIDPYIQLYETRIRRASEEWCDRCGSLIMRSIEADVCWPCENVPCYGCDTGHVGPSGQCREQCGNSRRDADDLDPEFVTDGGSPIDGENGEVLDVLEDGTEIRRDWSTHPDFDSQEEADEWFESLDNSPQAETYNAAEGRWI